MIKHLFPFKIKTSYENKVTYTFHTCTLFSFSPRALCVVSILNTLTRGLKRTEFIRPKVIRNKVIRHARGIVVG